MTHRGPFQPLLFCDSVILYLKYVRKLSLQSQGLNFFYKGSALHKESQLQ